VDTSALTAIEIDLERLRAARARLSADFMRRGLALTDTLCVMAAVAAALPNHPLLNGSWHADGVLIRRRVNLALEYGERRVLVRDAQDLNIRGLARALRRPPETAIEESTFAIVEYEPPIWWGAPALAPRYSATLGIGAARARPVVVTEHGVDRVAVRRMLVLSLVYDARVLDQCHADAFLRDLKARLEQFKG
jgi:pyruvate/2-oxoglutarate dehydrogenase complex dihydrolipoamide acyltransferase (E2) component